MSRLKIAGRFLILCERFQFSEDYIKRRNALRGLNTGFLTLSHVYRR